MAEAESITVHQYLSFYVAGDEYGLPILQVREIIEYAPVTRMPTMPPSIRGVTNLRGRVVPVVDLAVRMGLPETVIGKRTCVVMVEATLDRESSVVGLLVESVSQVVDLPPTEIEPPPAFGTRIRVDFVKGMGKVNGKFVPLLEMDKLLDTEDLLAAGRTVKAISAASEAASAEAPVIPPASAPPPAGGAPGAMP